MENKSFKSVAFGGFDKEEVISYIQQAAQENTAAQEALQKENNALREERDALKAELEQLRETQNAAQREETEKLRQENQRLSAEAEKLRPDAEAYRKISGSVGDIECQARKRACELETETVARLTSLVAAVRQQYRTLTGVAGVAAEHVTAELRNVEVNLSQMPRALDQAGTELDALEETLQKTRDAAGK